MNPRAVNLSLRTAGREASGWVIGIVSSRANKRDKIKEKSGRLTYRRGDTAIVSGSRCEIRLIILRLSDIRY